MANGHSCGTKAKTDYSPQAYGGGLFAPRKGARAVSRFLGLARLFLRRGGVWVKHTVVRNGVVDRRVRIAGRMRTGRGLGAAGGVWWAEAAWCWCWCWRCHHHVPRSI